MSILYKVVVLRLTLADHCELFGVNYFMVFSLITIYIGGAKNVNELLYEITSAYTEMYFYTYIDPEDAQDVENLESTQVRKKKKSKKRGSFASCK